MSETYVSIDVEANGPIPGRNSMWSFGAAAFTDDGQLLKTYYATLADLPEASPDPKTLAWWNQSSKSEALQLARLNQRDALIVMSEFAIWLDRLPNKPVAVGYPVTYDFMFLYWYLMAFAGRSPFGFQGLDIKTLAMAAMGTGYKKTTKDKMPNRWFKANQKHTHQALDDAIEQGYLFFEIKRELEDDLWALKKSST